MTKRELKKLLREVFNLAFTAGAQGMSERRRVSYRADVSEGAAEEILERLKVEK